MTDFVLADLMAINAAIASGTRSVSRDGRTITYASLIEMLQVRNIIRVDLGLVGDDAGRTHRYGSFGKGLE